MVSQVYYDVRFSEKVNYCTYLKKFSFKNLVQSEVLCLKESEQSYYAFLRSDSLTVTGNQIILNYDLMYRQESIWKTTKKEVWNYDVYDQNSLFYLLMTGKLLLLKSLYYQTHPMQICVITSYVVVRYYL